jgi:hypothetical protein
LTFFRWEQLIIINPVKFNRLDYPYGRAPWALIIKAESFHLYYTKLSAEKSIKSNEILTIYKIWSYVSDKRWIWKIKIK